ncbi:LysM peptidoglycan-binding domain-containing protein [Nocardioides piscis]|uniref:LysM peptidoglycan-binding domain-containing protein n=1 Tax=Nocardioides piscis TaxID=2714938 RepID=A0A6G7YKR7_9ACTN|nr:LysM peptidoglycan-binding domain-containing protein [Nocardioides piscis]
MVLIACGAAVVAGLGSPAVAGSGTAGGAREDLVGLPLPDRAVAAVVPVRPRPARQPPGAVVATPVAPEPPPHVVIVRPGDSLWSIAAASLPPRATPAEVDGAWRALYAANRAAIGADPDLVLPGTELVVHPALDPEPRKARP